MLKDLSFNLVRHPLPGFKLGTPTTARYQKIDALDRSAMVPALEMWHVEINFCLLMIRRHKLLLV